MKDDRLYNFEYHIFQNQVVYRPVCNPYYICLDEIDYISNVSDIARPFFFLLYEIHTLTPKIP